MRNGDFEKHLNRMRKIYRRKLEKVLNLLKGFKAITVFGAHSGFHLVLGVKNGMSEKELVDRALTFNLKVYPVSAYSIMKREETPAKIVLGFAGIPEQKLEEAIGLLFKSWGIDGNTYS